MIRLLIGMMTGILLALLTAQLVVRYVDPLQLGNFLTDLHNLDTAIEPDAIRRYKLIPGDYQFSTWNMTVNADTFRRVPDTPQHAACTIAMLGDSVTMNYGVSDTETWVNLLAQAFSDVQFLNTGVTGYNIQEIYATYGQVQAEGYFYLLISNDAADFPYQSWKPGQDWWPHQYPTLSDYWRMRQRLGFQQPQDYARFERLLGLLKQANVQIVALDDGRETIARAHVPTIANHIHPNSPVDGHPNAQGSIEIAERVAPYVQTLVERVC